MSTEDRKIQLGVSVDTTEAEQGFAKISAGGRNMAQQVGQAGQQAAHGIDAIGTAAEGPAAKVDRATSRIVASIQRATAAAESAGKSGSAFYESLANQRGANLDVLKPYLAQLDAVTQKQMDAKIAMAQGTASLNSMGMSAQATAAAMRNVPAQFTDIVTSLQAGQAPMTVLLQQGGQLKDMFGGIGNASKALGSYVVGLINPFTLLAAGVGAVGYAYYKGSQESDAYNKALILSGNIAGTTSGQLGAMAASISKVTGTQSAAAAALAEMAQASGVGRDNLESFTSSAIKFEKATGTAVSETVKQFGELAKAPLEASLKLNEVYNYLTASVYKQIKALEDQGKTTEAADLAQKALSDTLDTRSKQMVQNLGYVERGWKAVKDSILGVGDAIAGIGRPEDQAANLRKQLDDRQTRGPTNELTRGAWERGNEALKTQLSYLQEQERQLRKGADLRAAEAAQVKALVEWDKTGVKYLSDKVKMEQDINAAKNLGVAAGESQAKIEERIKSIRDSYAKKGGAKSKEGDPFAADREYAKEYAKAWEDFTKIGAAAAGKTDELSKAQERLVEYLKSPAYANHSAAMREIVLQSAYGAIASEQLAAEKKKEAAAMKESADAAYANSDAIYKTMASTEDKLRTQIQENETIGMTAVQIAQLVTARDLEAAAALDAKAAIYEQANAREEDIDNIKRTADALRKLAAARVEGAVKKQEQADWMSFFTSIDNAAHQVWTNVLQGGQDIWSKLRNTAKTMFFDWLYQMTLKKWIFSIGATVSGSGAMAQAAGGEGGGLGGAISAGKSIYNAVTGPGNWFSDFGGNLAGSVSDFGTTLVDKGFTTFGTQLESFGLNLGSVSGSINTFADGLGYVNSIMLASKGQWGAAAGSAIGTYFGGPIGAAIGTKIGSWVDKLTGNTGTRPSIEGGYASAGTVGSANGKTYVDGVYGGKLDGAAQTIVSDIGAYYTGIVKSAHKSAGNLTAQSFIGMDGNGGSKGSQNALGLDAQLNGKWLYNRWTANGGSLGAGTTDGEMSDAVKLSSSQVVIEALKATDMGPALNAYLATVTTQGKTLAQVTAVLGDVTNFTAFSNAVKSLPFDYLKTASVEASKALIAAAGGLDKLGEDIGTYFELFGTEAEKKAALVGNLSSSFADLGITMPQTTGSMREWYKSEVARLGAMDLSVEANAKAYDSILKLAGGVDQLTKAEEQAAATKKSWQDQLDLLTGKTTQDDINLARDLASTSDESTKAIIRQIYAERARQKALSDSTAALEKAKADALNAAKSAFDRAVSAERTRLDGLVDLRATALQSIQGVFDLLVTSTRDLYAQVNSTAAMGAAEGRAYITTALALSKAGGTVPDQATLSTAIAAAKSGLDSAQYTSQFEADRQRLIMAGELSQLQASTGVQLTVAEQQLQAAKDQVTELEKSVKYVQDLIDATNGVDTSVKSVGTAIADLVKLLTPSVAPDTGRSTGTASKASTGSPFVTGAGGEGGTNAYGYGSGYVLGNSVNGKTQPFDLQAYYEANANDPAALKAKFDALGITNGEAATAFGIDQQYVDEYFRRAGIPRLAVGTNYVPQDMLAVIHQGEAVVPRAYNPALAAPAASATNAALMEAVRSMAAELAEIKANTANTADSTSRSTKVWEGAAQGSLAITTTTS